MLGSDYFIEKHLLIKELLSLYNRAIFRVQKSSETVKILNAFTGKVSNIDLNEEFLLTNIFQKVYYLKIRRTLFLVGFIVSLCLSLIIIYGEFLVFQGKPAQKKVKSWIDHLPYEAQLVYQSNQARLMDPILLPDHMYLSKFICY